MLEIIHENKKQIMKFRYLISLAVATALLTGCNNEDDFGTKVTNGMLRATMESNASGMARAGFDANGAFYWSEGDRLGVTMQDGADYTTGLQLLLWLKAGPVKPRLPLVEI